MMSGFINSHSPSPHLHASASGLKLRLRNAGPIMSGCPLRHGPGVACSRFVGWSNEPVVPQTTHDQKVIPNAIQEPSEPLSALNHKSLSLVKSNGDLV